MVVNKHVDVASLNCKKVEDHVAFFLSAVRKKPA